MPAQASVFCASLAMCSKVPKRSIQAPVILWKLRPPKAVSVPTFQLLFLDERLLVGEQRSQNWLNFAWFLLHFQNSQCQFKKNLPV